MLTSAIKKQTSVCCSISLNPYKWYFKLGNLGYLELRRKKEKNEKQFHGCSLYCRCQLLDQLPVL